MYHAQQSAAMKFSWLMLSLSERDLLAFIQSSLSGFLYRALSLFFSLSLFLFLQLSQILLSLPCTFFPLSLLCYSWLC